LNPPKVNSFLAQVACWASSQTDVVAVALLGSFARGTAKETSDLDLLLLVYDIQARINDRRWVEDFGGIERSQLERWGDVTSIRVSFKGFMEVEFALATPDWANAPVDARTRAVVENGFRALLDKQNCFANLTTN